MKCVDTPYLIFQSKIGERNRLVYSTEEGTFISCTVLYNCMLFLFSLPHYLNVLQPRRIDNNRNRMTETRKFAWFKKAWVWKNFLWMSVQLIDNSQLDDNVLSLSSITTTICSTSWFCSHYRASLEGQLVSICSIRVCLVVCFLVGGLLAKC